MKKILTTCLMAAIAMTSVAQEKRDTTFTATGNPFLTYKYLGDPAALVDGDKVYIYAGHDQCPNNREHYDLREWCILSTSDMKTFTEHAYTLKATDFPWAQGEAWASHVVKRGNKYYWYVTAQHKHIHGKAIGVAVADSPTGPFIAQPEALITNDMTTLSRISWEDIDPAVFIDDDGQAYMWWGNQQLYYIKLKDNMVETEGPIMPIGMEGIYTHSMPNKGVSSFTEAPYMHKRKDWYYLTFSIEFPEKTAYAMSKDINGPWEYKGILNEVAGNCNTNHHSIIEFKGDWYFIYHNGGINTSGSSYRRSLCIDRLYYKRNGEMKRIQMTSEGLWGK